MKKLIFIILLISNMATAQIFECIDYQKAINQKTRSRTGMQGINYWQNRSEYKIYATIDVDNKMLVGEATITYFNQSPDTLKEITLKLYQNLYKNGAIRNVQIDKRDLHDGVYLKKMAIDKQIYIEENQPLQPAKVMLEGSNLIVNLQENLLPGNTTTIDIVWQLKIPEQSQHRKMGYYKDGAFFIGLWYPQVAVYDDIAGWDNIITYAGIQDFYNDFSNYDVYITAPENYMLWGTGKVMNEEEVYPPEVRQRLQLARTSDEVVTILEGPVSSSGKKSKSKLWHFSASDVTDFAFGMATDHTWEAGSIKATPGSGKRTFLEIVYHPENKGFAGKTELAKKSVKFFSSELPGYPFPFDKATIFNGLPVNTLAVEYPMITNMSFFEDEVFFKSMVAHKLFHNYFPFYMGINEKNCIWMDEGWAFYIADKLIDEPFLPYSISEIYSKFVGRSKDMPLMASSTYVIENNLPTQYFLKPFMAYSMLESLLGKDQFQYILQEYIDRWHGKHPTPYDFFYTIEDCLGQDLSWLWNPLFFEFGYPDLAIEKIEDHQIIIKKVGVIPVPVKLTVLYADGSSQVIEKNIEIWKNNDGQIAVNLLTDKKIDRAILGDKDIPDVNPQNNVYSTDSTLINNVN